MNKLDFKFIEPKVKELLQKYPFLDVMRYKGPKKFISVDFGCAFVKITYMEVSPDSCKLLAHDLKAISSPDAIDEIKDFLKGFIEANSITEKETFITLPEMDAVIIKHLTLPVVPKEEILGAAKWQLREETPFDLEGAAAGWQVVEEYTDEDGAKKNEIVFAVAGKETIGKFLSIAKDCNLEPICITSGPFNYASILNALHIDKARAQAVLDVGCRKAMLCIYVDGKLKFIRVLPFSSNKLNQSLTGTLVSDKGKIELTLEEAENIKCTFGIPQDTSKPLKDGIEAMQIISLMRPALENLVKEIKRSFDYFSLNAAEELTPMLYLVGGGSNLKNLEAYLNKELNIKVSKLLIPDCIDAHEVEEGKLDTDQNQVIGCIGAVLSKGLPVNLLPREIKAQKVELIEKVSLRIVSITVAAIFLSSLFGVKLQVNDYRKRLKNAQAHLETIKEIRYLNRKISTKEGLIRKIQEQKVPADGLLRLIGVLIPKGIALNELLLDQDGHTLTLRGEVLGAGNRAGDAITGFMKTIESSSFFTEAGLVSSRNAAGVQKFEIKCDLVQ